MATVRTVLGRAISERYDVVLAHEHIFIDITCWTDSSHRLHKELAHSKVSTETLPLIRQHPFACPDNLLLDDDRLMTQELSKLSGTNVLVIDVTPDGIGRDPVRLAAISRSTGVDIITGCGPYIEAAWDPGIKELSDDEFADRIVQAFASDFPPAVIGEIGTSSPITQRERRSLRGAAIAQKALDAPLYVHLDPWSPQGHDALDIIEAAGGNLGRVVLCHLDVTATQGVEDAAALLDRGCYIAFDIWGDEDMYGENAMPTDADRAAATWELVKRGYGQMLLHSQDVCTKSQLSSFGGAGYSHMHTVGRELLTAVGLSTSQVHDQLSGNAIRMLRA